MGEQPSNPKPHNPPADLRALIGIAKSLAIYYGLPHRAWQFKRFYSQFVRPSDLVFDVGAHVGNRLRALAGLEARVVAVEPHPTFATMLRRLYGGRPSITIVEKAIGNRTGETVLHASRLHPTVTTASSHWAKSVAAAPGFTRVTWDRSYTVAATTLDALIAEFGHPTYCKLDVEGSEYRALLGLSRSIPLISFEYIPAAIEEAVRCLGRLQQLDSYKFNWTVGESVRLRSASWVPASEMVQQLRALSPGDRSGDIYAQVP